MPLFPLEKGDDRTTAYAGKAQRVGEVWSVLKVSVLAGILDQQRADGTATKRICKRGVSQRPIFWKRGLFRIRLYKKLAGDEHCVLGPRKRVEVEQANQLWALRLEINRNGSENISFCNGLRKLICDVIRLLEQRSRFVRHVAISQITNTHLSLLQYLVEHVCHPPHHSDTDI